ncbi:hypothetical protein PS833_01905 [Pseudomonas fluorescens]|uniref:Uncharacterized protein n=1 Tax=Pseudomonas fluorescens TaxID=294 RepID=A0A5E7C5L7_PSEFL|nr:hypothetical protein PS833_01905 [Pseudomonas fluorescens]
MAYNGASLHVSYAERNLAYWRRRFIAQTRCTASST